LRGDHPVGNQVMLGGGASRDCLNGPTVAASASKRRCVADGVSVGHVDPVIVVRAGPLVTDGALGNRRNPHLLAETTGLEPVRECYPPNR
jgi:hypothetical protein